MTNQFKTAAIIAAAGASRRMGGGDKIFTPLAGRPVLAWALDAFERCPEVGQVIVVVSAENVTVCRGMVVELGFGKVTHVCAGGARRQDSVQAGLGKVENCDWVIVHDGARPLVTAELIRKGLAAAGETGAAVAAVPVTDTIKIAGDDNLVGETPEREHMWAVQTPQVFRYDILAQAYGQVSEEVTDDAALVERLGYRVKLYQGAYDNIKITGPDDLALAGILLQKRGK